MHFWLLAVPNQTASDYVWKRPLLRDSYILMLFDQQYKKPFFK